jgi:non-specific serine/threonine protein kinase
VIDHLRGRQMLLVLDNFEHVVDAATGVASIIHSSPGTKVLVTSRFALRLSMEREFPLLPLRTPDFAVTRTAHTLRGYPAVELFAERAAAVKPGFSLDDESTVAVAEICQRLDGLPLAIELAAARIKLFSPRALLARLDRRLELLSGGARDLPERHQTLRQAIRWSYDLLEPGEQAAFRRLAVFAGGCSLETAETVCAAAGEPLLPVLEAVAALVDKSLLRQQTGEDNEPRFLMLETVREFALEELAASGEETITRDAHADVFIALAESAAPRLSGPEQQRWLPRLEREHDDLRAAFDWVVRSEDPARALRLSGALCRFWIIRGFHTEGRQRLQAALALPLESIDEGLRARVLMGAAILAFEQSELNEASELLEQALEHFRASGDTRGIAETLNHMGWVSFLAGEIDRADALTSEALALHEKRGDTRGVALSLTNLGASAMQRGDLHRARTLHERGLALRRSHNDPRSIAYGRVHLGWTLIRLGSIDEGMALAREAEHTLRALGDKQILAFALFIQGEAALERGQADEALPLFKESVALGREIMQGASLGLALAGFAEALALTGELPHAIECSDEGLLLHQSRRTRLWSVIGLRGRAEVRRLAGNAEEARNSYQLALQFSAASGLLTFASQCLAGLAALDSQEGRHERALRLAAAARALSARTSAPKSLRGPDPDRIEELALQHLAEDVAARARAEGAAVELDNLTAMIA